MEGFVTAEVLPSMRHHKLAFSGCRGRGGLNHFNRIKPVCKLFCDFALRLSGSIFSRSAWKLKLNSFKVSAVVCFGGLKERERAAVVGGSSVLRVTLTFLQGLLKALLLARPRTIDWPWLLKHFYYLLGLFMTRLCLDWSLLSVICTCKSILMDGWMEMLFVPWL